MFNILSQDNAITISSAIIGGVEFEITSQHGFWIHLNNGYVVSVQWGGGTYSDNHDTFDYRDISMESKTAEIAVINPAGELIETPFQPNDTVIGWQTMEQVSKIVDWASKLEV